ncbi:hypothetical protein ACIBJC_15160 [Streptomyces sp. NPDC050509]|uniref:hypothetical protein n=1 Tax=Streptomyces sp. NPDC050509 TaxID=3365620 RepID=UPI00379C2DE5
MSMDPSVEHFRLHPRYGEPIVGRLLPDGRALVLDDPEYGLVTGAASTEDLVRGYPGSHIEWPQEQEPTC